jgi:hypothetical protein
MAENFDAYRDALVVETLTVWPDEVAGTPVEERKKVEERLHADPRQAAQLEYVRLHAGFCRRITVTAADLARVR